MNSLREISSTQNCQAWYLLSLFYARKDWQKLIRQIAQFYESRQNLFQACIIFLSEDRGEHIRLALLSSMTQMNLQRDIACYFESYMASNPSESTGVFPYGRAVWCNYPNNTLAWNLFKLPNDSEQYIRFHKQTFAMALTLLEDDLSADAVFSAGLYLYTKIVNCIVPDQQKDTLLRFLHNKAVKFENYSSMDSIRDLIDQRIDLNEINEAIDSYLKEDSSECLKEVEEWLDTLKSLAVIYGYESLCSLTGAILGLKDFAQIMILELLANWYNTAYNRV